MRGRATGGELRAPTSSAARTPTGACTTHPPSGRSPPCPTRASTRHDLGAGRAGAPVRRRRRGRPRRGVRDPQGVLSPPSTLRREPPHVPPGRVSEGGSRGRLGRTPSPGDGRARPGHAADGLRAARNSTSSTASRPSPTGSPTGRSEPGPRGADGRCPARLVRRLLGDEPPLLDHPEAVVVVARLRDPTVLDAVGDLPGRAPPSARRPTVHPCGSLRPCTGPPRGPRRSPGGRCRLRGPAVPAGVPPRTPGRRLCPRRFRRVRGRNALRQVVVDGVGTPVCPPDSHTRLQYEPLVRGARL